MEIEKNKSMSVTKENADSKFVKFFKDSWRKFKKKHSSFSQFLVFFFFSVGVTILQLVLMPLLKALFAITNLININFQILALGKNFDESIYYMFDFEAGSLAGGGGGGLAFFLAVQITILIAQVINFFAQRNITFKSDGNPWKAAFWYFIAYVTITFIASALRGLYTVRIYNLLMNTFGWGATEETIADFITMLIYSGISFLVFFPIFKLIFPKKNLVK